MAMPSANVNLTREEFRTLYEYVNNYIVDEKQRIEITGGDDSSNDPEIIYLEKLKQKLNWDEIV